MLQVNLAQCPRFCSDSRSHYPLYIMSQVIDAAEKDAEKYLFWMAIKKIIDLYVQLKKPGL